MTYFAVSIPEIGLYDFEGEADVSRVSHDAFDIDQIYVDADGTRENYVAMDITKPAHRAFYAMIAEVLLHQPAFVARAREELGIVEESANAQAAADYYASVL